MGIVKFELFLYSVQFILILYSFPKARYKFQKLQTIVVLLYAFQLGTIGLTALIVSEIANNSIDVLTLTLAKFIIFRSNNFSYCDNN